MPMFDIEDSKDVELENNKTSKETLAKIKKVEGFKAKNNEAGIERESDSPLGDIVELKPTFCGIGVNLRTLYRKYIANKQK
tara:strand:+ start:835 stop:1077 length:243 start_codon:yes stop_codon:yes gene_type:complete